MFLLYAVEYPATKVPTVPSATNVTVLRVPRTSTALYELFHVAVGDVAVVSKRRVIVTGAAGYACMAWSTGTADNFRYTDGDGATTVDDTAAGPEWRARAQAHLDRFDRDLKRLATARARSTRARLR